MAVFAPIPSAMVRMTVSANPGDLRNCRNATRISCMRNSPCYLLPAFTLPSGGKFKSRNPLGSSRKPAGDRRPSQRIGTEYRTPSADRKAPLRCLIRKRRLGLLRGWNGGSFSREVRIHDLAPHDVTLCGRVDAIHGEILVAQFAVKKMRVQVDPMYVFRVRQEFQRSVDPQGPGLARPGGRRQQAFD